MEAVFSEGAVQQAATDNNRIHRLSSVVIDQIAAGEVIERPAAAVKELLENAIDARATNIRLDLEGGGLERFILRDNGWGMSASDLLLCTERHATSKIRCAEDLNHVLSMGFRGEALSSLCSVASVVITSRRSEDTLGHRVWIRGGERVEEGPVGAPVGTTVDVRELFFNVPARRKFLKSAPTEQAHILDASLRVMLGARRGSLIVTSGGRRLLDIPHAKTQEDEYERAILALGRRVDTLIPFQHLEEGIDVQGYLAPPKNARRDSKGLWTFVNQRFVRERTLQRATMDAFRGYLEPGRHPVAVVYIQVHPETVDVNVHPQKLELRFRDSRAVYRAVSAAIAHGLRGMDLEGAGGGTLDRAKLYGYRSRIDNGAPALFQKDEGAGGYEPSTSPTHTQTKRIDALGVEGVPAEPSFAAFDSPSAVPLASAEASKASILSDDPFGDDTIIWEEPPFLFIRTSKLWLVDRRVLQRTLWEQRFAIETQASTGDGMERVWANHALLFPEVRVFKDLDAERLETHLPLLERLGFRIDSVGPERYALLTVPCMLYNADFPTVLSEIGKHLSELPSLTGLGASMLRCLDIAKPLHIEHAAELIALFSGLSEKEKSEFGRAITKDLLVSLVKSGL